MRPHTPTRLGLALLLLALAGAFALAQISGQTPFGKVTVTGGNLSRESFTAPWKWTRSAHSGQITVTSGGMNLTCDALTAWLAKKGNDFERLEATGNIHLQGTYSTPDKQKWDLTGSAQAATFTSKDATGVLHGNVHLRAVNEATKEVETLEADKFTYNVKTGAFAFDSEGEKPVHLERTPAPAAPTAAPPAPPSGTSK
jgi:lipopolysaccharide transport protein LptA